MSAFMLDQTRQNIGGVLVRVEHVKPRALNQHQLQHSSTCKACKQNQSNQLLLPMAVFLSAILWIGSWTILLNAGSCWFFLLNVTLLQSARQFPVCRPASRAACTKLPGVLIIWNEQQPCKRSFNAMKLCKAAQPILAGERRYLHLNYFRRSQQQYLHLKRHIGREARTQTGHSHSHRTFSKLQTILTFHVDKIHLILESFRKCTNLLDFLKHCIPMMAWRFRIQLLSFPFIIGIHPGCFKFSISGSEKLGRLFANGWWKLVEYLLFFLPLDLF